MSQATGDFGTKEPAHSSNIQIIADQSIVPEVSIYGKSDDQSSERDGEKKTMKKGLFIFVMILAICCIAVGVYKAWDAFRKFDDTILREKDSQFYNLITSEDINIENSLDAFCREAETFFSRQRLEQLVRNWRASDSGDLTDLKDYFAQNTLIENPVYADMLMLRKDKITVSASGGGDYHFLTEADGRGIRLCGDDNGRYYMAFESVASGGIRYEALMSLEQLYIHALGGSPSRGVMLMDSTSKLVICRSGDSVMIATQEDELDGNTADCRAFLTECQGLQKSDGRSFEMTDENGKTYTARMVVQPSGKTTNGEFAIGITADYDKALAPSRQAATNILIFGGMALAGILVLIFMLILMRRAQTASENELEYVKKKNSAMEELNQNMQALAHHQRLETIGTMTASIAHDFNNLLTPIMGYSIMAAEMLPDDQTEIQDYMMEVYNASVKAKDIVQRLADLSKKGKEESFRDIDPIEIIRNSLKVTLPAKPKNVEVRGRFSSGNAKMRGDTTQISQLVINIVLNAYDAMREKGGTLTVSTRIEDGRIAMRFSDTGTGMDAETLARIFDPFYTTKESGKGTGLGLAIVHQICDTHGGKVYVDSEPGVGTEFRITFPMIEDENTLTRGKTRVVNVAEIRERLDDKPEY